ncbi:head-tail connector protein [Billgrantia ethanolica]|uniref:Phage gp6-like head-tail connector protein n=1 Tax=Billgrantia ethanolica TaxID=2733486 RepID=A0ABS9A034_9GAMM|nr:head-tail connector protein [Halomonas ethanolica]MCE8002150.1 phage gp6-like head-tail connector protein [Halomonas ethanolica]
MTTVTLQEAKDHLRVLEDDEDALITSLVEAAEGHIAKYLGDDLPEPMPAPVRAAVLLLVGDLFEYRERQAITGVGGFQENPTFQLLLNPYRSTEVL